MILNRGRSSGCSSFLGGFDCGKALGRSFFPTFRPASDESIEPTSSDELLDLVSELNTLLRVMVVVMMIEAELVRVVLPGVCAHLF